MHDPQRLRSALLAVFAATLVLTLPSCMIVVAKGNPDEVEEWWEEDEDAFFDIDSPHHDGDSSHGDHDGRRERDRVVVGDGNTIGPFSEGILAGPLFFASGQIPRDPETGSVMIDDAGRATRSVLESIGRTLEKAGLDYGDVVKVSVFLKDIADYDAMNRAYREFFPEDPPARSTVAVAALARDAVLEIEVIAVRR